MRLGLLRFLFFCSCVFCSFPSLRAKAWVRPQGFFEQETVRSIDLRPGVTWISVTGLKQDLKEDVQMLSIDLRNHPELSIESVLGERNFSPEKGRYFARSTPSQMLTDQHLLAVINASFFDISASQSPLGIVMRNGLLLRQPAPNRTALLVLKGQRLVLARPGWSGSLRFRDKTHPLANINEPRPSPGALSLYLRPWQSSPTQTSGSPPKIAILLKRTGDVNDDANKAVSSLRMEVLTVFHIDDTPRKLAGDELLLTIAEDKASEWATARSGEPVTLQWQLTQLPPGIRSSDIREAVAGASMLVRDGKALRGNSPMWKTRHPRSAIGLASQGRQTVLLVVDGRSQRSAGMDLFTLADYLVHLGAEEALNLDGGGSSALVIYRQGKPQVLNHPSDWGRERLVPTGIGLRLTPNTNGPNQP